MLNNYVTTPSHSPFLTFIAQSAYLGLYCTQTESRRFPLRRIVSQFIQRRGNEVEEKSKSCNFLYASTLLYMRVCPTIGPSDGPSISPLVRPTIRPSIHLSVCPSIRPSVRPSIHPSVGPSVTHRPCIKGKGKKSMLVKRLTTRNYSYLLSCRLSESNP